MNFLKNEVLFEHFELNDHHQKIAKARLMCCRLIEVEVVSILHEHYEGRDI